LNTTNDQICRMMILPAVFRYHAIDDGNSRGERIN